MISEDLESEFNNTIVDKDHFTQTSTSSVLIKLPVLGTNDESNKNKVKPVFEHCQIIQDPNYTKIVTIVKEFVTEEIKDYSVTTGENNKASRYKYTKEIIHPFFTPKLDDTKSCEVLVREALRSAIRDFPDFLPSLEVYHSLKYFNKEKERICLISLISKIGAQTSYLNMDSESDSDKVCLTDCDQAEDPKKCKQACKELNEERKSAPPGSPLANRKPPYGKPNHAPPKCEKVKNCKPKIKKVSGPSSGSSSCDKDQNKDGLVTDLNTNEELNENADEVIVTDVNTNENLNNNTGKHSVINSDKNKKLNEISNEVEVIDLNTNIELNQIIDKEENKADLGNIVPNIISDSDSTSIKSFIDAHNETISTIKVAMEDFIEIVYKTTQDAVSLIATESGKALAKIKAAEMAEEIDKKLENKSSGILKGISFFRKNKEEPKEENNTPTSSTTIIDKVLEKADSALCVLTNKITKSLENIPTTWKNLNEKVSPHDRPKLEDKPAHVFTPDATNGVFSSLKNKIYSIFSDTEPKSQAPSRNSSTSFFSFNSNDKKK